MKKIIKLLKYGCLILFIGSLGYSIYFIFLLTYNQPRGFKDLTGAYFYGYLLHMPLWILAIIAILSIIRYGFKRKLPIALFIITLSASLIILCLPYFSDFFVKYSDTILLILYVTSFLMCVSLLDYVRRKL